MGRPLQPVSLSRSTEADGLIVGLVHAAGADNHYDVSLAVDGGPVRVPRCGSILVETASDIINARVEPPRPSDLVLVEVGHYDPTYLASSAMNYFVIVFRLKPEIDAATGMFSSELEELASPERLKTVWESL